jgi:hypothetical protein
LNLNLKKKLVKWYIWSITLYGADTWTLLEVDQEYLESFEMWCWRRMEKICWTDLVKNEEVLHRAKGERSILRTMKRTKANWFGHILHEKCLPKHFIKGKIEGSGSRGRRKKLLNDCRKREGTGNW